MSRLINPKPEIEPRVESTPWIVACVLAIVFCGLMTGCQDRPLYALKVANPYYSMREWKNDETIGITDHQRREQLSGLADTMASLPAGATEFWSGQLKQMIENDQSAEMRRLAVHATGEIKADSALAIIELGLDDESMKVRMRSLRSVRPPTGR